MNIELYLIRHGIAANHQAYTNDQERPLTKEGYEKTTKVAKQLLHKGLHFDMIVTSPLVRAKQTAAILQEVGLSTKIQAFPSLAPDGDILEWVNWLEQHRQNITDNLSLALVGHQPDLGNWAETLVWGKPQQKFILKKAGVIGLTLPTTGTPLGYSQLFLLTSPKWLI